MILQLELRIFIVLLYTLMTKVRFAANSIHLNEGTSTAEMISGDIFFEIIEPESLEYTYRLRPAKDFGAPFNVSFQLKNTPLVPVYPRYGCVEPTNKDDLEGNVAFIERGECSFKTKTIVAEMAGARAAIITDTSTANEDYFIEMIDDDSDGEVHIPSGFLMGRNGIMILRKLEQLNLKYAIINLPVNLTFTPVHKINQPPWLGW